MYLSVWLICWFEWMKMIKTNYEHTDDTQQSCRSSSLCVVLVQWAAHSSGGMRPVYCICCICWAAVISGISGVFGSLKSQIQSKIGNIKQNL